MMTNKNSSKSLVTLLSCYTVRNGGLVPCCRYVPALTLTSCKSSSCCSHYSVRLHRLPSENITNIRTNFQDQSWIRISFQLADSSRPTATLHHHYLLQLFASFMGPGAGLSHTYDFLSTSLWSLV
jgi:hypothetical protein